MKSTTTRPPRSRIRSCRPISSAASRLVLSAVSSISSPFVERAELMSIAVSASVWSITMLPPDGSDTLWLNADSIWLSIWNRVNSGTVVVVELELAQALRQHALHELERVLVDRRIVDHDLADVVREVVAQRAHDRVAFLVDQERGGARDDDLLDRLPDPQQVVHVPAQLFGAAADACGADDAAHAVGRRELLERLAHDVAVLALDPARDAAGARVVRHQDDEAAREADVGGEGRALGAALFLIDLDDDFLAFAQHVADLDAIALLELLDEVLVGDFLERQEPVALDAVIYEARLEARFDPSDAAFIDVGLALLSGRYLDIEVIELLAVDHGQTQLFFLSCVH